jgi:hypothetical protein
LSLLRLGAAQNLDIPLVYVVDYAHAGLAPVVGIARTPSFVVVISREIWSLSRSCVPNRGSQDVWRVGRIEIDVIGEGKDEALQRTLISSIRGLANIV